ncbi:MAG: sigma 54-interacting transcriptional regulator [Desulfomonile tiedjei]|nr:sigma 54-interacting transcriptional regulator [Desulfomonile tiedjei]
MSERGNSSEQPPNQTIEPPQPRADFDGTENPHLRAAFKDPARGQTYDTDSRFRQIYNKAPVMMHSIDKNGVIRNLNRKWIAETGYSREEVIGRKLEEVMTPESAKALRRNLPKFWENREVADCSYQYVKKDGTIIDVLLDAVVMEDPNWGMVTVSVSRNITEQKRAEEALRRSEERLRAIFEGATDCIFLKDRDLRYTHANPALAKLFNLPADRIVGMRAEDLFGEQHAGHIKEADLRVLAGESIEEERTLPVNQVLITFHEIRVPLRDSEGSIVGICGISRNISERKEALKSYRVDPEVYKSDAMTRCLQVARRAAATDSMVLLLGESGTGKDYLARWIHDHSNRSAGPYLSLNCAAISKELAESELFGHEAGAFTGARGRKRGMLELAEGGTLLLNEIGELPLSLQAKLLSFLDTRSFLRVGGEKSVHCNVRLMAATHRDLASAVEDKRFLGPLFYRLNVFPINVPPLRNRLDDIPILVDQLVARLAAELQLTALPVVDEITLKSLSRYHWPGNVRELRNVLERSLMVSEGDCLSIRLPSDPTTEGDCLYPLALGPHRTLEDVSSEVTKLLCQKALQSAGSRTAAARMLGISRDSLYRYMKKFGLNETVQFSDDDDKTG